MGIKLSQVVFKEDVRVPYRNNFSSHMCDETLTILNSIRGSRSDPKIHINSLIDNEIHINVNKIKSTRWG